MDALNPYKNWIYDLKQKIQQSQIKASMRVNSTLIELYWEMGREISERNFENTYGSGFFKQLSTDLKKEFPEMKGFSSSNLRYIEIFYKFYCKHPIFQQVVGDSENSGIQIFQQVAGDSGNGGSQIFQQAAGTFQNTGNQSNTIRHQVGNELKTEQNPNRQQVADDFPRKLFLIPWFHHVEILTKCKTREEALFYVEKTIENGWSRSVLLNMISAKLIESQGKAVTNFANTLPSYESDLVRETLKDPYNFDFLMLTNDYKEKELEDALTENISKFLIELGNGFAFVGKQVELAVSNKSFFIDLLFYHIKLKRYVVIELKTGSFEPEFAGKLNFYVTAVDRQLRDENDNATIGLLICKDKDEIIAEYSLADLHKPLGISSYELQKILPDNLKSHLPSIEEVEEELKNL